MPPPQIVNEIKNINRAQIIDTMGFFCYGILIAITIMILSGFIGGGSAAIKEISPGAAGLFALNGMLFLWFVYNYLSMRNGMARGCRPTGYKREFYDDADMKKYHWDSAGVPNPDAGTAETPLRFPS
jgi:hypothetical protein